MATKSDLKKFRHDISALKKRGLISGVDARSATPNKRLNAALEKYDAVLSGKASAVKLSNKGLAEYKDLGKPFEIAAPKGLPRRVIIPHDATERVTVTHGKVRVSNPAGITRTILPVKFSNLEKYLNQLRKQKIKLAPGEKFAFRFFDNRSFKTFRSMDALVDYLSHYESIFDSIEDNDAEAMQEIYQNLEIVKVDQPDAWPVTPAQRRERYRKSNGGSAYQKRKTRLKDGPEYKRDEYLRQQAERQAAYRKRLKGKDKAEYNAAGLKRAKKSKRKAKAKKGKKKSSKKR